MSKRFLRHLVADAQRLAVKYLAVQGLSDSISFFLFVEASVRKALVGLSVFV